jgi:hypothetical protein
VNLEVEGSAVPTVRLALAVDGWLMVRSGPNGRSSASTWEQRGHGTEVRREMSWMEWKNPRLCCGQTRAWRARDGGSRPTVAQLGGQPWLRRDKVIATASLGSQLVGRRPVARRCGYAASTATLGSRARWPRTLGPAAQDKCHALILKHPKWLNRRGWTNPSSPCYKGHVSLPLEAKTRHHS